MISLTLHVWRQDGPDDAKGAFETYRMTEVDENISFLEMMDLLNEQITEAGGEPDVFRQRLPGRHLRCLLDGDQRASPRPRSFLHHLRSPHADSSMMAMRSGSSRSVPPPSPSIKDLMVDRSSFDRIIQSGGYVTVHSGPKPDPNSIPIPARCM